MFNLLYLFSSLHDILMLLIFDFRFTILVLVVVSSLHFRFVSSGVSHSLIQSTINNYQNCEIVNNIAKKVKNKVFKLQKLQLIKMIKNKLICLDYPNPESVNIRDPKSFRQIVLWLEDQKIRHYKIDERAELRKIGNPEWQKAYEKYKADLNCPKELVSAEDQLKWICNHAVKLEYMDNIEDYKSVTSQAEHSQSSAPSVKSVNPFDNLDCKFIYISLIFSDQFHFHFSSAHYSQQPSV